MINTNLVQAYTSKNTSVNQVPMTGKIIATMDNVKTILDFACGKYDTFKTFCNNLNIEFYGYDKYNRDEESNIIALGCKPDLITCNNLLNVIMENEIIEDILKQLKSYNCKVFIKIYEGNKTGEGKESKKDCYQRNQRTKEYLTLVNKYFNNVTVKGELITCEKEA